MSYALTWRCNSKCKVCNTWKINDHKNELTLEEIKNIFKDNFFNNIKETVLTGGEPFLRYDITDIAKIIHNKTGSSIGVTTNALLSEKVFVFVKNMLKNNIPIGVYISLDGPEKIHDELRGVSGNFKRIIKLLRRLVSIEDKNLTVSAGMTVSKDNINYINETDNICKEIGCELSIRLNEYAGYFHNRKTNLNFSNLQKKKIIKSLLFLEHDKNLKNYYKRLISFLERETWEKFSCTAAKSSLIIDPRGNVYPCPNLMENPEFLMGNLRNESFKNIWTSYKSELIRKKNSGCHHCLNICEYFWGLSLRVT